eukprot:6188728-Pleurochrysis_carterae.AAC.3
MITVHFVRKFLSSAPEGCPAAPTPPSVRRRAVLRNARSACATRGSRFFPRRAGGEGLSCARPKRVQSAALNCLTVQCAALKKYLQIVLFQDFVLRHFKRMPGSAYSKARIS